MHILILPSEHYITPLNPLGGIFQNHLAKLLQGYGNKVGVLSAGFVPFEYNYKSYPYFHVEIRDQIPVFRKYVRTFFPGRIAIRYLQCLLIGQYMQLYKKYTEEYGVPDLIHAHNALFAGAAALRIKEKFGVPYVVTEHSSLYERGYVIARHIEFTRKIYKGANARTFVSTRLAQKLKEIVGKEVEPYTVIYNVLEELFLDQVTSIRYEMNKAFSFLAVGSLDANKNHVGLIRAFHALVKQNQNIALKLNIAGSGALRTELLSLIKSLGLEEQVHLLGHLGRDQIKQEMMKCNVLVLPSFVETFGVVLIEALSLGKPVISTYCGGPEDIVCDLNGLLVAPGNDLALTEAMQNIIMNYASYEPRAIIHDCMARFGADAYYKRIETVYKSI